MAAPVNIFLKDDQVVPGALPEVQVHFYEPDTLELVADTLSDAEGVASALLPGGLYELRFFKRGVLFGPPVSIEVLEEEGALNDFDARGTPVALLPPSPDPLLCRCTARFLRLDGTPMRETQVVVMAQMGALERAPKVVGEGDATYLVASERLESRTDREGAVRFDLPRGGRFGVYFAGEDVLWPIEVPDAPAANLVELIHPVPALLEWDGDVAPGDTLTLAAGDALVVPYAVLFSDRQYHPHAGTLAFSAGDPAVVEVQDLDGSSVRVTGKTAGTTTVMASIRSENILPRRYPAPLLGAAPLAVIVTP